jgi:hypothetical protein
MLILQNNYSTLLVTRITSLVLRVYGRSWKHGCLSPNVYVHDIPATTFLSPEHPPLRGTRILTDGWFRLGRWGASSNRHPCGASVDLLAALREAPTVGRRSYSRPVSSSRHRAVSRASPTKVLALAIALTNAISSSSCKFGSRKRWGRLQARCRHGPGAPAAAPGSSCGDVPRLLLGLSAEEPPPLGLSAPLCGLLRAPGAHGSEGTGFLSRVPRVPGRPLPQIGGATSGVLCGGSCG